MRRDPTLPARESIRLPGFDYAGCGVYFLTVCAYARKSLFGSVRAEELGVSPLGALVQEHWQGLASHFDHVALGPFVVMPNHLHGTLFLADDAGTASRAPTFEGFGRPVPGSVPTIIRSFKSGVTREARLLRLCRNGRIWQRGYIEHVVRSETALERIYNYIAGNPDGWHLDCENPQRTGTDEFDDWLSSFCVPPKPTE